MIKFQPMADKKEKNTEEKNKVNDESSKKHEHHHHTEHHSEPHVEHHNKPKKKTTTYVVIAIIIVLVLIFAYTKYSKPTTTNENNIAAKINDEIITFSELDKAFNALPQQYQLMTSKKTLLNQMIEARVLYQEAKKQGVTVSQNEAQQYINQLKIQNGLTDEQFLQALAKQNLTEEELTTQFIKQLTTQKFLNETILSKEVIAEKDIKSYYNENKTQFKIDEQVSVRHVLIGNQNLTTEKQNETAQALLKTITKDNFCGYVTNYTTDTASISTCGEYNFTKIDQLVQEFKDFSFNNNAGTIGIVKSQFGFHIIWVVKKTPAKTLSYNDVKDKIKTLLINQKAQEDYKTFYEALLKNYVINIYYQGD